MKLGFSLFRHHQTGLMKEKCRRENLDHVYLTLFGSTDTSELEAEDEESFEELTPLQEARLTTAGHSLRTAIEKYAVQTKAYGDRSREIYLQRNAATLDLHRRVAREWHVLLTLRKHDSPLFAAAVPPPKQDLTLAALSSRPAHAGQSPPLPLAGLSPSLAHAGQSPGPAHAGQFLRLSHVRRLSCVHCSSCKDCSSNEPNTITPPPSRSFLSPQLNTPGTHPSTPSVMRNILPELLAQSTVKPALDNTFSTSKGLSKLFGPFATWKSVEQERAMKMVADNEDDLLIVLRTGGGKSAVVAGPILFETGYTVWIAPLRALQSETNRWMARFGIKVSTCRYRVEMRSLGAASNWGKACRTVLLSATVPPSLEKQVMLAACGSALHPMVIRGDPRRPNLQITVNTFAVEKNLPVLVSALAVRALRDYPTERSIIYCLTIQALESLFQRLSADKRLSEGCTILKYHGQMDGCGIDVPNVRQVVIYAGAPSVLEFWQQAGRAGRDGRPAKVSVLYCPKVMAKLPHALGDDYFLLASCGIFPEYVKGCVNECRRVRIEACVGGRDNNLQVGCGSGDQPCNYCACPARAGHLGGHPSSGSPSHPLPSISPSPAGLPTPSDSRKAKHSRRVQSGDADSWEVGLRYLKSTSLFLSDYCPRCLLNHSTSAGFSAAPELSLRAILRKASDCTGRCHVDSRYQLIRHCFRCLQIDHSDASNCLYFERTYSSDHKRVSQEFICGGCRCNTLQGRLLHVNTAKGNNCPYKPAAEFCFVAYALSSGRKHIETDTSPYMEDISAGYLPGRKDDAGRYLSWLTHDGRDGNPAGLLRMLQYLFRVCDLEKLMQIKT